MNWLDKYDSIFLVPDNIDKITVGFVFTMAVMFFLRLMLNGGSV